MTAPLWSNAIEASASATNLTEPLVANQGFVITVTLSGAIWKISFDAIRQDIIDGITSDGNEGFGFNNRVIIPVEGVVRTDAQTVTITVPPTRSYMITVDETLSLALPGSAVEGVAENCIELETGDCILLETGEALLAEDSIVIDTITIGTIIDLPIGGGSEASIGPVHSGKNNEFILKFIETFLDKAA